MKKDSILQKLKNIEIKKSYVVLIVLIAVAIRFWGESSVTMLQKNVPVVTSKELTQEEIYHFIQTKQEYINENITIDPSILVSRDLESYLDSDTHEWFLLRGWRPKRFFYVEERINTILNLIYERQSKLDEAARLDDMADRMLVAVQSQIPGTSSEGATAAEFKKKAHDMRYYVDREIRHAGITKTEDDTIMENITTIESLLRNQ